MFRDGLKKHLVVKFHQGGSATIGATPSLSGVLDRVDHYLKVLAF